MRVLVTVGSTKFDFLIVQILSRRCLTVLAERGCTSIVIQYGNSLWPGGNLSTTEINIEGFAFKPSLSEDIQSADLVISHAGTSFMLIDILDG